MRWKQSLTPLETVPDLEDKVLQKLSENHILTAEELVGQIEAAPTSIGDLLKMDDAGVQDLGVRARQVIDPEVVTAIEGQRGRKYKLGALPPDEDPSR